MHVHEASFKHLPVQPRLNDHRTEEEIFLLLNSTLELLNPSPTVLGKGQFPKKPLRKQIQSFSSNLLKYN